MDLKAELGKTLSLETIEEELKKSKPAVLFLCQVSLHLILVKTLPVSLIKLRSPADLHYLKNLSILRRA